MATYTSTANGNWSTQFPNANINDVIVIGAHTISVDVSFSCNYIQFNSYIGRLNFLTPGVTATVLNGVYYNPGYSTYYSQVGILFRIDSGTLTWNGPLRLVQIATGGNNTPFYQFDGGGTLVINGDLSANLPNANHSYISNMQSIAMMRVAGHYLGVGYDPGNIVINGNVNRSGTSGVTTSITYSSGIYGSYTLYGSTYPTVTINGDLISGSNGTANIANHAALRYDSPVKIIHNGNVRCTGADVIGFYSSSNVIYELTGELGRNDSFATTNNAVEHGIYVDGPLTMSIVGNVYGGNNVNTVGSRQLRPRGATALTVTGTIYGGLQNPNNQPIVAENNAFEFNHTGTMYARDSSCLWHTTAGTYATKIRVSGPIHDAPANALAQKAPRSAIQASCWQFKSKATAELNTFEYLEEVQANKFKIASAQAYTGIVPGVADVRQGISYLSGSLIGTLAVPLASQVQVGVAVDNTVGTALVDGQIDVPAIAAAIWSHPTSAIVAGASGTIGKRLMNTATVESTGNQIAALGV